MLKRSMLIVCGCFCCMILRSQTERKSLEEVIELARSQSTKYKLAQTYREISHYQFITFKSEFKPQVTFYGNAPVFNKEYFSVRQPDGTIKFQSISQNNANLGFGLSQQLSLTGGEISVNTAITRFDDFKLRSKQYNNTPIYLRLSQPLFAFNELKWLNKIEPLKYEEAKRAYVQELENIAQQSVQYYFDLLNAQRDILIANANLNNAEINYSVEKQRVKLGTTTEDKLLQIELSNLNSQQGLEKAKYNYQIAQLSLKIFIGSKDSMQYELLIPRNISDFHIDLDKAIEYATLYRSEFVAFERKRYEAQRDLVQARAAKQQINLVASFGLNNAGEDIGKIYQHSNDQQRLSIGFSIPVVDWGRAKARYNTAKALERLTDFNNDLDEATIKQEIITLVKNFEMLRRNIRLTQQTDSVAQRRYVLANNLYQVGKLSVTDLNLAQAEKDNASRNYINALRQFWDKYFFLRRLTLYDFENQRTLFIGS